MMENVVPSSNYLHQHTHVWDSVISLVCISVLFVVLSVCRKDSRMGGNGISEKSHIPKEVKVLSLI